MKVIGQALMILVSLTLVVGCGGDAGGKVPAKEAKDPASMHKRDNASPSSFK